jgi:Tfp pilus assembly protein PilF
MAGGILTCPACSYLKITFRTAKGGIINTEMKKHLLPVTIILMLIFPITPGIAAKTGIKSFALDAVEKGWAYFNRGDYETALKRFNQATIIDPEFAPGYFGKAYVYSLQDNLDLAIENYRKTIELADPPYSHAYGNLGLALLIKGQLVEGHQMLLKALEIDPDNADAHVNIAQSYCAQEDSKKAWDHIKKAQELKASIKPGLIEEMKSECPEKE